MIINCSNLAPSRLLDLLHDINSSPAIPSEKRIDVSIPPPSSTTPSTPIDQDLDLPKDTPLKRLEDLLSEVPHLSYDAAKDAHPELVRELEKLENGTYPTHFLTADDIDTYLHDIDSRLEPDARVPTLAPAAHPNLHPPVHPLLKNPNSSISWLQRNKPSIFTHDLDNAHHDDNAGATGTDREAAGGASNRKSRGGKTDRSGKPSRPSKRTSAIKAAAAADKGRDWDVSMDEDPDFASTPLPKGKRKRAIDSDAGYRPKGSGSRPTKKKRKSEGADSTPTISRKSKKDAAAAVEDD